MSDSGGDGWQGATFEVRANATNASAAAAGSCVDTDGGALDSGMDDCAGWYWTTSRCPASGGWNYDDDDFTAGDMCCTCGGGAIASAAGGTVVTSGTLTGAGGTDPVTGAAWLCLADGCYALVVGGGSADSEIGFEFEDEHGGHFQALGAPYAEHFCVEAGDGVGQE